MEDREGNVISMTTNKAGNFWTYAPGASDPYTVSTYHGHEPFVPLYVEDAGANLVQPANPNDPRTWKYKTWTRKGRYDVPQQWIRREWRTSYRGQKQIWFLLRLVGRDCDVCLRTSERPEFDAWRWSEYWIPLESVNEFKRDVYQQALNELARFLSRDRRPTGSARPHAPGSGPQQTPERGSNVG